MVHGGEINETTQNIVIDENDEQNLRPGWYIQIQVIDTGSGIKKKIVITSLNFFIHLKL